MTTFTGGPANGQTLWLGRAPMFLRVVRSSKGFDALDQLNDMPDDFEEIFVYILKGKPGQMHLNRSRKAGGSGWFMVAEYQFLEEQPLDVAMRENENWKIWTLASAQLVKHLQSQEQGDAL